jgi:Anti-anti-sigma regulatory factor (antagonist of anti-sigma factor)
MQGAESPKIVNLQGSLTIDRAAALKGEILEALDGSSNVLISLTATEDIDLACLQILYSARSYARSHRGELHFLGSMPPRIAAKLSTCGFLRGFSDGSEGYESALVNF